MAEITIESEITGTVWKIEATPGQEVAEEDVIMILESMKMEIPVIAAESGVLKEILIAEGDNVAEGQAVAILVT